MKNNNLRRVLIPATIALLVSGAFWGLLSISGEKVPHNRIKQENARLSDNQAYSEGRQLYRRYCATCHGSTGRGKGPAGKYLNPPPMNFHSDTAAKMTDQKLFTVITEGKLETGMPAWESTLSEKQRHSIVVYIRKRFIQSNQSDTPSIW